MKKSSIIWLIVIVIVVLGGYLWWTSMPSYQSSVAGTQTSSSTNSSGNSTTPRPTSGAALTLNNSGGGTFGAFLSASNGMTLYQSTKDAINVSNCTGACASTWLPYTVSAATAAAGSFTADPGITGKIGTIKRANGSFQVTYRGLPLYFYVGDAKPGNTNGEALNGFTEVAP